MTNEELYYKYAERLNGDPYMAKNTRLSYLGDVRRYLEFMEDRDVTEATAETVTQLIGQLHVAGRSNASIQRIVIGVRNFYKYLKAEGYVTLNPTKDFNVKRINELLGY